MMFFDVILQLSYASYVYIGMLCTDDDIIPPAFILVSTQPTY